MVAPPQSTQLSATASLPSRRRLGVGVTALRRFGLHQLECFSDERSRLLVPDLVDDVVAILDLDVGVMTDERRMKHLRQERDRRGAFIGKLLADLREGFSRFVLDMADSSVSELHRPISVKRLEADFAFDVVCHYAAVPQVSAPETATVMVAVMRSSIGIAFEKPMMLAS